MTAGVFLRMLHDTGHLRLDRAAAYFTLEHTAAPDVDLLALDARIRAQLAGAAPPLLIPVAQWAADMLYSACACLAFREMPAETVTQLLARPAPETDSPAAAYSADLAFCYLPDVLKLARGLSPGDPLVEGLIALGRRWPLSSVGIAEVDTDPAVDPAQFINHPSLATLYIDRVITRNAAARLKHPRTASLARAAIGLFPELAPHFHLVPLETA